MRASDVDLQDADWRASSLTHQRPRRGLHRLQSAVAGSGLPPEDRRSWLRAIWLSDSDQPIRLATVAGGVRTACSSPSMLSQSSSLGIGGRSGDEGSAPFILRVGCGSAAGRLRVGHDRSSEPHPCLAPRSTTTRRAVGSDRLRPRRLPDDPRFAEQRSLAEQYPETENARQ
jgi:hypothetical protein